MDSNIRIIKSSHCYTDDNKIHISVSEKEFHFYIKSLNIKDIDTEFVIIDNITRKKYIRKFSNLLDYYKILKIYNKYTGDYSYKHPDILSEGDKVVAGFIVILFN